MNRLNSRMKTKPRNIAAAFIVVIVVFYSFSVFTSAQYSEEDAYGQKVKEIKGKEPDSRGYIVTFDGDAGVQAAGHTSLSINPSAYDTETGNGVIASVQRSLGRQPEVIAEFRNIFNGVALDISEEEAESIESLDGVAGVYPNHVRRISLLDSIPQIRADKAWDISDGAGRKITGKDTKIAFLDTGIDYSHPDFGSCSPKKHVINGIIQPYIIESPHPYDNNFNTAYEISFPGFSQIAVHFANISTETFFDKVIISDADGNVQAAYTGTLSDVWTPSVAGGTIFVTLASDSSVIDYGFYIDMVIDGSVTTSYDWSNCTKIKGGFDFYNGDQDPSDEHGHGTHVGSIAAGNGSLFKGVAPDAEIYAFQVCSPFGFCFDSDILAGLDRSMDLNNNGIPFEDKSDYVDVVSISLGGPGNPDDLLSSAVDRAVEMGITVVIAAGNSGSYGIESPGTARSAITVGAIDKSNQMAFFSSQGPVIWGANRILVKPDVVAPGVNICAAMASASDLGVPSCTDAAHMELSGTSMSTPHVSGIAALIKQKHPEWTPLQIKTAIKNSAINLGFDIFSQGSGRADALRAASFDQSPPISDFTIFPQNPLARATVAFNAFRSLDFGGTIRKYEWDFNSDGIIDAQGIRAQKSFPEGTHMISLVVTDNMGAKSVETKALIVGNDPPVADFVSIPQTPRSGQRITLDASRSYDPDGAIMNYWWDTDNDGFFEPWGRKKTVQMAAGTHAIGLKVRDNTGAEDMTLRVITVSP